MASRILHENTDPIPNGTERKIGIVVSTYNRDITEKLLAGCLETLKSHAVVEDQIHIIKVPGSFELPMGAKQLLGQERFDAIICLGCILKGETRHDEYISQAVANGIMQLSLMSNTPVIFGVLTPNSTQQAKARAGGKLGNKGIEAAETALRMAAMKQELGKGRHKIGFS